MAARESVVASLDNAPATTSSVEVIDVMQKW
jgi:hypothetical protein